jgi:FdhE protein
MDVELDVVRALGREIVRLAGTARATVNVDAAEMRLRAGVPALAGERLLDGPTLVANARAIGSAIPSFGESILDVVSTFAAVADDDLAEIALAGSWGHVSPIAARLDVEEEALVTVLDYAARPALLAAARPLAHLVSDDTPSRATHCPMCGSPPLLAELSGKDLARYLRCGRCGARWRFLRLACACCGSDSSGALHAPGDEGVRQAEYCDHCHGYLKSVSVLAPLDYATLLETDLRTAALDLAAFDRGYSRRLANP